MSRFQTLEILTKAEKFFPDLAITELHRFVNFHCLNLNTDQKKWQKLLNFNNEEYIVSKNIFKASFKTHVLDWQGLREFGYDVETL